MKNNFIQHFRLLFNLLLALVLLGFIACEQKTVHTDAGLNEKLNFNPSDYQKKISELLSTTDPIFTIGNSAINYFDTLKHFYSARNFQPLFVKSFEEKFFIDSLISILGKTNVHGLNPEDYHYTQIKNEFWNSTKDDLSNIERYKHLANTEILVCDAILRYAYHLRYGVLNPTKIFLDSYYFPIPDSLKKDLFLPLKQENIFQYLNNIQPKSKKYTQLQSALIKFEALKNLDWQKISAPSRKIKFGESDSSLVQIAMRLISLGFIDTSVLKIKHQIVYDSLLTGQIKNFQRANGLIDDGVINKSTVEKLNTPLQEYINKIKANLERFRWIDYSDSSRYILVNIPEFKLYVIENDKELFDIKVCTGRKRYVNFEKQYLAYKHSKYWRNKPEDWETPILYSKISHMILNPTWTVPFSIMREEIVSKVRRDSAYLKKANFRVYKNGTQIDPANVNLNELNSGSIPYTIIQNPGAGNALGKIKFMFDNPFGVYLHDTPTRAPFSYSNRAVSHGCVRVEKPFQLAEYILKDNSKWTLDYLKIETGSKVDDKIIIEEFKQKRNELRRGTSYGQTTDVKLDKSIPLFIDYYTAWVDKNGVVNFRDDVYRHDKIILEHLKN